MNIVVILVSWVGYLVVICAVGAAAARSERRARSLLEECVRLKSRDHDLHAFIVTLLNKPAQMQQRERDQFDEARTVLRPAPSQIGPDPFAEARTVSLSPRTKEGEVRNLMRDSASAYGAPPAPMEQEPLTKTLVGRAPTK